MDSSKRKELVAGFISRLAASDDEAQALREAFGIDPVERSDSETVEPTQDRGNEVEAASSAVEYYENAVLEGGSDHWPIADRFRALDEARAALDELRG